MKNQNNQYLNDNIVWQKETLSNDSNVGTTKIKMRCGQEVTSHSVHVTVQYSRNGMASQLLLGTIIQQLPAGSAVQNSTFDSEARGCCTGMHCTGVLHGMHLQLFVCAKHTMHRNENRHDRFSVYRYVYNENVNKNY